MVWASAATRRASSSSFLKRSSCSLSAKACLASTDSNKMSRELLYCDLNRDVLFFILISNLGELISLFNPRVVEADFRNCKVGKNVASAGTIRWHSLKYLRIDKRA